MQRRTLNVLLVEGDAEHAALIRDCASQVQQDFVEVESTVSVAEALRTLRTREIDLILLALDPRDNGADDSFSRLSAAVPQLPIVVLASVEELDVALALVKRGAQDCLVKSQMTRDLLSRAIRYAVERKRIERGLQHYASGLERANGELQQFTRAVTHELKSPLAAIEMQLQAIGRSAQAGGEQSQRSSEARAAAGQMRTFLDHLLQYAQAGARKLEYQSVDCDQLLQEVVSDVRSDSEWATAHIACEILPTLPGDPAELKQVFHALILGALKRHGDRAPDVEVSAEFHGRDWVFSVQDRGIGIAARDQERAFEMFSRPFGDAAIDSGVGLAICKRIVEAHGGTIWIDSAVGRGSTLYFSLPARRSSSRSK